MASARRRSRHATATSRHHVLTLGVTLIHVPMEVATISIIMRGRRWLWHASMILGAIGTLVAAGACVG